ncbi:MAG TPA: hypothetical protein PKA28_19595 [Methylomusa anaerophila]|uniref:Uncharacterized protein n=1 Tax=Methylomusa anaerophila TaxID=1930071 RepID=A0A348AIE8_9FIRM|nr:hypothetical protein [Methylomusa anaerophila]BBB90846.1 hypothetical protein MAMMFC1_01509 [Methylomusa anaerophila]HML90640.1 hypothetical protein [Methylomusa anaerophila]
MYKKQLCQRIRELSDKLYDKYIAPATREKVLAELEKICIQYIESRKAASTSNRELV